jgi:hypothetical protein
MSRRHEQKHLLHNWSNCGYCDRPQTSRVVLGVSFAGELRWPNNLRCRCTPRQRNAFFYRDEGRRLGSHTTLGSEISLARKYGGGSDREA